MTNKLNILCLSRRFYSANAERVQATKYVLQKHFNGEPKKSDFKIIEEELPDLSDGEILTEAEYLSVDPYMRAYMIGYKLPTDMIGGQVAKYSILFFFAKHYAPKGGHFIFHGNLYSSIVEPAELLLSLKIGDTAA